MRMEIAGRTGRIAGDLFLQGGGLERYFSQKSVQVVLARPVHGRRVFCERIVVGCGFSHGLGHLDALISVSIELDFTLSAAVGEP